MLAEMVNADTALLPRVGSRIGDVKVPMLSAIGGIWDKVDMSCGIRMTSPITRITIAIAPIRRLAVG
ncbi:hypothetical protein B7R21_16905 [Subtercola boreus]|uniref:Uncharacterized protein n=1 Tax=Subtercola boreus TaxID=120213 RepID=A0A3E0VBW1_9MICO|nr:hypothetical protein B7R21_16905 [Subtercola boreus]